jgi:hypothetical protein
MVHELQETDAVLRQLRGVERAIDDLILEVDAGLKRSSVLHADYFKQQIRYQRIIAFTIVLAALFLLTMLAADVIHEW